MPQINPSEGKIRIIDIVSKKFRNPFKIWKFDVNFKKILGSQESLLVVYPYPKSVLWVERYSIYSTKLVLKILGGEKGRKKPFCFSFAVTRTKSDIQKKLLQIFTKHLVQDQGTSGPGGMHDISKSRCHQILANTVYRIKIGLVEKSIKFAN